MLHCRRETSEAECGRTCPCRHARSTRSSNILTSQRRRNGSRKPLASRFDCESALTGRSFNSRAARSSFPRAIQPTLRSEADIRRWSGSRRLTRTFCASREHGARIIRDPEDFPYGERQYTCVDPAGHSWTFSETVRDVDPPDWGGELASGPPAALNGGLLLVWRRSGAIFRDAAHAASASPMLSRRLSRAASSSICPAQRYTLRCRTSSRISRIRSRWTAGSIRSARPIASAIPCVS